MVDLKARIRARFTRRNSTAPSVTSSRASSGDGQSLRHQNSSRTRDLHSRYAASSTNTSGDVNEHSDDEENADNSRDRKHHHKNKSPCSPRSPRVLLGYGDRGSLTSPKRRPSTTRSTESTTPQHPEKSRCSEVDHRSQKEEEEAKDISDGMVVAHGGGEPNTTDNGGGGETLASPNSNHTTESGIDRQDFSSPPSTAAAINNSHSTNNHHLPSINEHPASPTTRDNVAATAITTSEHPSLPTRQALASPAPAPDLVSPALASPTRAAPPPNLDIPIDENNADHDVQLPLSPDVGTPTLSTYLNQFSPRLPLSPGATRPGISRQQSIVPTRQTTLIKALLNSGHAQDAGYNVEDPDQLLPLSGTMVTRKIWVKRPGASPTLITINEDDLVDDVRELILRKYANSLGRNFDAPDLTLRVCPRDQNQRLLQPDEPMGRTLDAYFTGGQTVDDALLIDIPTRRTPKASPNPRFYADDRPHESGSDYFPPYPPPAHSHGLATAPAPVGTALTNGSHTLHLPPSMAILGNGQLPPLPSPGSSRRLGAARPKIQRLHTASPISTANTNGHVQHTSAPGTANVGTHYSSSRPARSRTHSAASSEQSSNHHPHPHQAPSAPPMPTPPIPERVETPPPPRISSPRPSARAKKSKKNVDHPSLPPGMLNGGVPPINVLIVEDNIINLKLLEAFVKRLKVRWQTAMNGRDAVTKWRDGGFHLVLMDIQLPVMNGLEATREIRRLEKVNSIGVFSSSASSAPEDVKAEPADEDKLSNTEMFKSPVIIVALTASSLQSDRHEALAAGCNDFLTKPVNFVWLERKVMEWGCMQALIDFDGWRKWKDFSQKTEESDAAKKAAAAKAKAAKKNRLSMTTVAAA
ncbi:response regulator mcs4 [Apiospora phragmitis]|uniref:Response regulator mcs4 n=1 Tax=Apiospora phragmitis TaxID=2905665 RepID=A0ABR1VU85_9PEZI